jgi:plasmid stabilization system protein ParE
MTRFRLSPEAVQDLIDIYEYIAQDNLEAAERVRTEIYDAIHGLAAMPGKGHHRKDLTAQPVLFWAVRSYQIIYRPPSQPLQVVAGLHGKRDIKRVLSQR